MASTTGSISKGSKDDRDQPSFIGFAGDGSSVATARYIKCTFNWKFTLNDDGSCVLDMYDFHYESYLLNSSYTWYISLLDASGSQTMGTSAPDNAIVTMYDEYDFGGNGSDRVNFDYRSSKHLTWRCPDIKPYLNDNYELILYVGGCSTYSVTDPVYPVSIALNFQGNPPIVTLFDYYPWERYSESGSSGGGSVDVEQGGSGDGSIEIKPKAGSPGWVSLNRNGSDTDSSGLHRIDGSWVRETNRQGQSSPNDHVHRYNSGWVKSQKV